MDHQPAAESQSGLSLPELSLLQDLADAIRKVLNTTDKRGSQNQHSSEEDRLYMAVDKVLDDMERRQLAAIRYVSPESVKNLSPPIIKWFEDVARDVGRELEKPGSVPDIYEKAKKASDRLFEKIDQN
ncbi:uncharacterized protein F4817DRAFT_336090 [Daldinia loculata]|uniref:uncharacterized protein n=1 Tax=Daldinia loculata TaxID=103429 RepID=UPI0020C27D64|nr:uncharacterized protein F4817DRAFT_336090 [Daldinia loculata]KAI1647841.1 hypothetical protein F4817DRAFT_336090 [Daldinia loculata]